MYGESAQILQIVKEFGAKVSAEFIRDNSLSDDDLLLWSQLLAEGAGLPEGQVSVGSGLPMERSHDLSSPALPATARDVFPPDRSAAAGASPDDSEPVLRLLYKKRIVAALSRDDVTQLRLAGRIGDEDLVCAVNGPWMRVGDFLSPAPVPLGNGDSTTEGQHHGSASAEPAPPLIATIAIPGPAVVTGTCAPAMADLIGKRLVDEWFVRVRGIHSAPLGQCHVKALFEAKEITRDNAARHSSWPENAWLPICQIPQLADAVK